MVFLSFEIIESRYIAHKRGNQFLPGSLSGNNKQVEFLSFVLFGYLVKHITGNFSSYCFQ